VIWRLFLVAALWPQIVGAYNFDARDSIQCVALWYALLADDAALGMPFDPATLDPETLSFYAAAVRLVAGDKMAVDAQIDALLSRFTDLRMDLSNSDFAAEEAKETARVRHGSRCNSHGESLPETRPYFFPENTKP